VTPPATPLLSCPIAIVITKHRCQYEVSRGSVPETYFLKVGGLCYEFERAYRQVPTVRYEFIYCCGHGYMGARWLVHDVAGQVAHLHVIILIGEG
jgi:hypothetical protein